MTVVTRVASEGRRASWPIRRVASTSTPHQEQRTPTMTDTHPRSVLPTFRATDWQVADLYESLSEFLQADREYSQLNIFQYAITSNGLDLLAEHLKKWRSATHQRTVRFVIGLDHGLTDPTALKEILRLKFGLQLMMNYSGIYHPKLIYASSPAGKCKIWSGSNNFTRDGLLANIEFSVLLEAEKIPDNLLLWNKEIDKASVSATDELIDSYLHDHKEHNKDNEFLRNRFSWSKRTCPKIGRKLLPAKTPKTASGNPSRHASVPAIGKSLVIEIMGKETSDQGNQIQMPLESLPFFGLKNQVGASKRISMRPSWKTQSRLLKMTVYGNSTCRLSLRELSFSDRPCLVAFSNYGSDKYSYSIFRKQSEPRQYKALLSILGKQTSEASRRWIIANIEEIL